MTEHTVVIYGIKNCDTMKKAMRWLGDAGVSYRFHDYRKDGVDADRLAAWCTSLGWESLLNRRGTTWRNLDDALKQGVDEVRAIALMLQHPALIRRPVLEAFACIEVGFSPDRYAALFS
ncbi:MAG: ArsC family reductase [Zetaproteobacteria bacterium CG06_land_8_20_14_3_00_59_53]|nr:MAG: arsenate reductase [Zetaproteobacteria bacterium CG2_30_59_37]PIO90921.1 MAG: ArsC family reductase [Zetaproteobacteria bacterium CG23_combo_of_CG06-09_8_20_14_all_59_86]PIQ64109.1 MAG: ArsC family reductase [Zetaproteobacteria bacterium CG11_big_fil_rev_8_21_14_0_20_59_439]PIU71103.1 MAG: ArsC family reductase [Zetaproteobacteria bacterium CG06_land_8_20_14_3_00_59_53]PIU96096.1 MAG: ArsC family reductase [Zetaproteobacteria bacterium CG03_land_8_20_14_0_80_59_51]PIY46355.1 MAG: ArsC 